MLYVTLKLLIYPSLPPYISPLVALSPLILGAISFTDFYGEKYEKDHAYGYRRARCLCGQRMRFFAHTEKR